VKRYVDEISEASRSRRKLAYDRELIARGLRASIRAGYSVKAFRADAWAAVAVAMIALPLAMALAVACDLPPQHGLYTAIVAGLVCSLLGGSRVLVTGPTAAMVVVLLPVVHQFGLAGALVAGMIAGLVLVIFGLARLGRLLQFVPHAVTTGLALGVAAVIVVSSLKDALGLALCSPAHAAGCVPPTEGTFDALAALWALRSHVHAWDVAIAATTIAILFALPRLSRRLPAPIVAIAAMALLGVLAESLFGLHATTIGSTFSTTIDHQAVPGIPPLPPWPGMPWHADAGFTLSFHVIRELVPSAFAIAVLAALEGLTVSTVADHVTGNRSEPSHELVALGVGNIVTAFFGGIAATGALARTATNIRAGARSPLAAALQAVLVLACTIALAPLLSYVPMAALAGLLVVVATRISNARHFIRLARVGPRTDVVAMLVCFTLTVAFGMVVAIEVGIVLAALLVIQRAHRPQLAVAAPQLELPAGVRIYEIAGAMTLTRAKTSIEALQIAGGVDHTVILAMAQVTALDASELVALESLVHHLARAEMKAIFAGLTPDMHATFERAGIKRASGKLAYAPDLETAVSLAIVHGARIAA
jgi:SulP family sulfate permease